MRRIFITAMVSLALSMLAFAICQAPALCLAPGAEVKPKPKPKPKPKSNPVTVLGPGTRPAIAADAKGVLYAVFERTVSPSQSEIACAKSTDGGKTWSAASAIGSVASANSRDSRPRIAVESGGAVDVVWAGGSGESDSSICFCRSCDGGITWSAAIDPTKNMTNGLASGNGRGQAPQLALGPDDAIHIVWISQASSGPYTDVFYCQSKDGGKSFGHSVNVNGNLCVIASQPSVVVSEDGRVHVVWLDTTGGPDHSVVFYRHWAGDLLASANSSSAIKVSPSARISSGPVLATGREGRVYIVWSDNSSRPDSEDVWYVLVEKRGKLTAATNLSLTTGVSANPAVCADRHGRLAIVWSDTSAGRPNIFARFSRDNLDNVSYALDLSHIDAGGPCKDPAVTILGTSAYVIWEQETGYQSLVNMASFNFKDIATGILF